MSLKPPFPPIKPPTSLLTHRLREVALTQATSADYQLILSAADELDRLTQTPQPASAISEMLRKHIRDVELEASTYPDNVQSGFDAELDLITAAADTIDNLSAELLDYVKRTPRPIQLCTACPNLPAARSGIPTGVRWT